MIQHIAVLVLLLLVLPVATAQETEQKTEQSTEQSTEQERDKGYVFSVTVESAQELDIVLNRAEDLRELFNPDEHSRIAIVLHGEELQLFQSDNYSSNMSLVERARVLDQDDIIDIKACQTRMRQLNIELTDLPSFIEQVPFAPIEIERLEKEEGFTRL